MEDENNQAFENKEVDMRVKAEALTQKDVKNEG